MNAESTRPSPALAPQATPVRRPVRWLDLDARRSAEAADGIVDLYDGRADVIVLRGALDAGVLAGVGDQLDQGASERPWARPNERMPTEDVQLLGTDTPATPTFRDPRGATLERYLDGSAAHRASVAAVFPPGFDAQAALDDVIRGCAGGRPVERAQARDGRAFTPFTIRRLVAGTQIGLHHDHHYGLELYRDLSTELDTGTLVSFVATLQAPVQGGELVVYGACSNEPDLPRLPNGFAYDLDAVEARYDQVRLALQAGDLFLLAAGRCLHRVLPIAGPRARITMGGFLALDRLRRRVLCWS